MIYLIFAILIVGIWLSHYQLSNKGLTKWFAAHFSYLKVWRVTYNDTNKQTILMEKAQANNYATMFGGVIWIDYEKGYW